MKLEDDKKRRDRQEQAWSGQRLAPVTGYAHSLSEPENPIPWPDPTPEMLKTPEFEAIWQCIKRWDINVPNAYGGYCGATGNHVRAILDALAAVGHNEKISCGHDTAASQQKEQTK